MKKVIACILTVAMIFGLVYSPAVSHAYAEDETVHEGHVHSVGIGGELITHETCDHVFGDWIITLEPTCTEAGEKTRTCSKCGAIETEEIEALDHDYIGVVTDPTCTEPGYTVYTCSRCGDTYTDDYETERGNIWTAWKETTPPT